MQRNNLIVFAIIAALVVAAWYFFALPSEEEKQQRVEAAKKAQEKRLAELKDKLRKSEEEALKAKKEKEQKQKEQKKDDEKKPPPPEKKVERPKEKLETIRLGGDDFHLTVDVISRGAGVRKVVLNRFEAANWRGRLPTNNQGEPTHEKLELIQDDEYAPSYRMYHYLDPKAEHPVFGLGEEIWKVVKPEKDDKIAREEGGFIEKRKDGKTVVTDKDGNPVYEEISLSTMVPGLDIAITKTYRLGAKDYHVAMKLVIEDRRTDKNAKPIPFRYQLTGAQGLPVEGEWYASTTRNAFMALVEPNGRVWRKLEDAARIGLHRGGERFPLETSPENRLQYAGVANQFFAAMVVVEPEKQDGAQPRELLAWARPTQETLEIKGSITDVDFKKGILEFTEDREEFRKRVDAVTSRLKKTTDPEEAALLKAQLEDESDRADYILLPRATRHLQDDLDVNSGHRLVLSFYKLPDGKRVATWGRLGETPRPQFDDITVRVNSEKIQLFPGDKIEHPFMLYHGPVKVALLAQFTGDKAVPQDLVDRYVNVLHLNTLTDYPNDNWLGKVSSFIKLTDLIILVTRFMHWLLYHLHNVFGWGLSIVVLTVMVRGAMFPISRRQALFSIKMQELGPELKKIQEKYPDDPQAKMQATQEFYKKNGINPLGSCWPVFLQMPIFLGLYFAFQESIHFRLADFLWIENLAAPDMLFPWTDHIPWISDPNNLGGMLYLGPYLNILPVIAVVFMQIQQSQTMPPPTDEQQATQQKMLKWMTIFFGVMFYKVAAGLCIYFISSSLWGLAERRLLPKKKASTALAGTTPAGAAQAAGPAQPQTPKWKGKTSRKDRDKEKAKETATPNAIDKLKALWRDILRAAEKK